MTQIDNAPRKPNDEEIPNDTEKLVHVDNLKRDPHNVRNRSPSVDLINSIRDMGFLKAVITRENPDNSDEYLVTDGWQRRQSACKLGFTHVPIKVYENRDEATKYAEAHSRGKEWGDVDDYNQDHTRVVVLSEDKGYSEKEAIQKRAEKRSLTEKTIRRNHEIAQLPNRTKELIRDPENRNININNTWKGKGCLNDSNASLNKKNAHVIAKRFVNGDISKEDTFDFGIRATRNSDIDILKESLENYFYDDVSVKEAFDSAKQQVTNERNKSNFNVGMVNLSEEEKNILSNYIYSEYDQSISQYFNRLVKEKKNEMLDKINKSKYNNDNWASLDSKRRTQD